MNRESSKRLVSLDIFRGATIGAMIIVNNLRVWSDTPRFPQLVHAAWNGCTLADLIFPFFIFIVGVSTVFSLDRRVQAGESPLQLYRHILTRTTILFLLGLLACSWFLFGWLFQAICPPAPTQKIKWAILLSPPANAQIWYFSLANLRIPGVLQRIALVYLTVALLIIQTRSRWRLQAIVGLALLLLYWGLMSWPGFKLLPGQDLGAYIDRAVFGEAHLWRFTRTWDPEGLLSTLPAIATGIAGALTGYWLRTKENGHTKLFGLIVAGCLGIVAGAAWGRLFPINKYLWTSSYTLYSAGWALVLLGACFWVFDLHEWRLTATQPLVWLGMNPLFAYVGAQVGAIALGTLYVGTVARHTHLGPLLQDLLFGRHWDVLGETRWHDPSWPMLYWALLYLTFWTLLTGLLYRRRIFFRV
jgi:predicted acyltransferase